MSTPLQNYKILDLSRILAGPFATQLLADLGADVLKIEPPTGDPTRGWGPPFEEGGHGESAYFRCANRGKRSLVLDLQTEAGLGRLHELIQGADVLVENFRPDSAESLGLTWEKLHERHPKLIVASVRGFASDVPAARRAGYDFIVQAESGWMSVTGEEEGRPMKVGMALVDVLCALYCANGVQAALLHRERTGEALHVEVPLMEAALAGLINVGAGVLMTGEEPKRYGNAHPSIVPYQSFPCSDGEIALGVGNDKQFEVLALWLGLDLDARPEWKRNRGRVLDRERLTGEIQRRLQRFSVEEAVSFCAAHAIPASPVRNAKEALLGGAGRLHGLVTMLYDTAAQRMIPLLASPILLNDQRACSQLPPPRWTQ